MVIHNTFGDFVVFLYVHMAHADGSLHPTEEEVVLRKMAKIFPAEENITERFQQAVAQYKLTEATQIMEVVRDSFAHFNQVSFSQRYKVYTDMYDIINADGKVDESETKALASLKEIIEIGAELKKA